MSENEPQVPSSRIQRLFDIRLVVGAILVVYGIILLVKSFFDTHAELAKAQGIRINLWTGIGLLVLGLLFLAWMRWRPLEPVDPSTLPNTTDDEGPRTSLAD